MAWFIGWETIGDGSPYMTRGWIGRLRLHIFHRGDGDPDCHDHPWAFWTLPLTSYVEEVRAKDGTRMERIVRRLRLHHREADFAHRVLGPEQPGMKIVTLVWRSRGCRAWGFWRDRPGESCWVPWRTYVAIGGKDAPCGESR